MDIPVAIEHSQTSITLQDIINTLDEDLPPPPSNRGNGTFEYITDQSSRILLVNAFQAITELDMWYYLTRDIDSFMTDKSKEILIIIKRMHEIEDIGHSGFSFGWTMRHMQFLAKNGENEYKKLWM